jgi:POT family proton-dependent oligopeptide transporter
MTVRSLEGETPEPSPVADVNAVQQLGFGEALTSLGYVFWIVGAMEMVERLAYYGVKAVATLYAKAPASSGGLGITMSRFGNILMAWALVQALVPVLTGGLSDRYGYKETIFASTVVKISGYLTMAAWPTYGGFFAGAVLLATGTGIFKPGIQATLVKATGPNNSSMAWGVFYQTVNIGGYIGPLVAGLMRKMAWRYVFLANAAVICLNFLLLLAYKEPGKAQRLANEALLKEGHAKREALAVQSLRELRKFHVWTYLLIFSGFWFMFMALFDVLPAHIDDWVDSSGIVKTLFSSHWAHSRIVQFFVVLNKDGTAIQPEGMLNLNAGMIMITCFAFAYVSGKMRATTSMVVGTLLATVAFWLCGYSNTGWLTVGSIAIFSVGEMLSSPKFNEFMGNFAPADKKAMYMGFSQIPLAIGWTLEGKIGPVLYDRFASKERFARIALGERGLLGATDIARVPEGEAFSKLVALSGESRDAVTHSLYAAHDVGAVWYIMAIVGVISAAGIYAYGRWIVGRASAPVPAVTK